MVMESATVRPKTFAQNPASRWFALAPTNRQGQKIRYKLQSERQIGRKLLAVVSHKLFVFN